MISGIFAQISIDLNLKAINFDDQDLTHDINCDIRCLNDKNSILH